MVVLSAGQMVELAERIAETANTLGHASCIDDANRLGQEAFGCAPTPNDTASRISAPPHLVSRRGTSPARQQLLLALLRQSTLPPAKSLIWPMPDQWGACT